ncbi:hypothetical protein [uncultured Desulfovibrio sp.]|uniref:hypothetical protein n=1 Tax=uncultured Desulfovibrio sp. TaxID=167968 RepID=UPI00261FDDFE|nr:hypothetical protein [uncultured Desulfovibrio sp.]
MSNTAISVMERHHAACLQARDALFAEHAAQLHDAALRLARVLARQGTVFLCGIGDAAVRRAARQLTDALADGYALRRPALPAVRLDSDDMPRLARRLESLGMDGDALLVLHQGGEGDAEPLLRAARSMGMESVGLPCAPSAAAETPLFPLAALLFFLTDTVARLVEYHLFENTSALLEEAQEKE